MEVLDLEGLRYLVGKLRAQSGGGTRKSTELTLGADWSRNTADGYYSQTAQVSGMTAADRPCVAFKAPLAAAQREQKAEAFRQLFAVESGDGTMVFYAGEQPETVFDVIVEY